MSDLPEIDPCEPLPVVGDPERELKYQEEHQERFFKEMRSDEVESRTYNYKTKEWTKKKYKKGRRVYLAKAHDGSIIVNDKQNFGLCGMGCLTSYWNVRYDPKTGEVIERIRMTEEEMREFAKKRDDRTPIVKYMDDIPHFQDKPIWEVMNAFKEKLYKHAQQVIDEVGRVPCVPLADYKELKEKYGDDNPKPDLSRYDMEMPDKFIANGTLEEARDYCGFDGYPTMDPVIAIKRNGEWIDVDPTKEPK